jgi:hypothetical protein
MSTEPSTEHLSGAAPRRRRSRGTTLGLLIVVAVLSAHLTWAAGRRGLFALDQSILFDGGYRVLCGQVPFRDFVAPVGPVSFWLQGALFALFGVGWRGYLLSAAVLDAAAAGVAFLLARRLFPGERWAPLLAAAGTGAWFLPPSGTPWMDAVAFLLILLALAAVLRGSTEKPVSPPGSDAGGPSGDLALATAGALTVAAFLTKQNAAVAALPGLVAVFVAAAVATASRERGRQVFASLLHRGGVFLLGATVAAAVFAGWLTAVSDPGLFVRHVLEIPAKAGWERLWEQPGRTLVTLLTGAGPRPLRGLLLLSLVPGLVAWVSPHRRRWTVPLAVLGGLFMAQNFFLATSNNQPEISLPFAGLLLAVSGRVAWGLASISPAATPPREGTGGQEKPGARRLPGMVAPAVAAVVTAAAIALVATAVDTALSRRVHEGVPPGTRFPRALRVDRLEALRWGEPTVLEEGWDGRPGTGVRMEVDAADVETLVGLLQRRGEPFFVFPDWTLLYGVVGMPSPQPLLWFHPGLSYPRGGDPALDRWIVDELERHGVRTVVLEEVSWLGTDRRLADFPALRKWLHDGFVEGRRIGPFRLLER